MPGPFHSLLIFFVTALLSPAQRLHALFDGYSKAYGTYRVLEQKENGKHSGAAETHAGLLTDSLFQRHLEGKSAGLGIIMLRDDGNTVSFGAIDLDDRSMNHQLFAARIEEFQLPLVLCRSKSGGGHFYCFTSEPVGADIMVARLTEWSALLGIAGSEIFPKQTTRMSPNDIGNWINIPYLGGDLSTRTMVAPNGDSCDLIQFLDIAERRRVTPDQLRKWETVPRTELFADAPPCLSLLHMQGGFADGSKKEGMFSVGIYLRLRYGDDWKEKFPEYNAAMAQLKLDELNTLIKGVGKDKADGTFKYFYKCSLPPIAQVCNKTKCRKMKYGVGGGRDPEDMGINISGLTRYEPPSSMLGDDVVWRLEINGAPMQVDSATLLSARGFALAALTQTNVLLPPMADNRWVILVMGWKERAGILKLPASATFSGQVMARVTDFVTSRPADTWEKLMVTHTSYVEEGRAYFRPGDLARVLDRERLMVDRPRLWTIVQHMEGDEIIREVNSKPVTFWWIPVVLPTSEVPSVVETLPERTTPF